MIMLTTKDIASFPVDGIWFKNASEVSKLCHDGKLFGIKTKLEKGFSSWQIPAESLAYFMRYNSLYEKAFLKIQLKELDPEMKKKTIAIQQSLNRDKPISEEQYSIASLSNIFGVPKNQIVSMFCANEPVWKRMTYSIPACAQSYSHGISLGKIVGYLNRNPSWVDKLYERQKMMLATGDLSTEHMARHLLMVYSYYKDNGYLV